MRKPLPRSDPMTTIPLGVGIYQPVEAAHLLGMTPSRVRRWIKGYTYMLHGPQFDRKRRLGPVIGGDLPIVQRKAAVSFLELMELRVVRSLVDEYEIPLQTVRKLALRAKGEFHTQHPLANRNVYVEGRRVFAALTTNPEDRDIIELTKRGTQQVAWADVLRPFLRDVEFDKATSLAKCWWPMGREWPVVLNPSVAFGAPTIQGTRVRTTTAASMALTEQDSEVARSLEVTPRSVTAAIRFEQQLRAA